LLHEQLNFSGLIVRNF